MFMLLAAGAYSPSALPMDIILIPPDKANAGVQGNQWDILKAMAGKEGTVTISQDHPESLACYEKVTIALTSRNVLFRRSTGVVQFNHLVSQACRVPGHSSGVLTRSPTYTAFNELIRRRLQLPLRFPSKTHPLVLFVNRNEQQEQYSHNQIRRRFLNFPEMLQATKTKLSQNANITGVDLQDFSFVDQVQLFSQTAVLVAMHGAGLTNIMFMPPNSIVIEIIPNSGPQTYWMTLTNMFQRIAQDAGVHYVRFMPRMRCDTTDSCVVPAVMLADVVAQNLKRAGYASAIKGQKNAATPVAPSPRQPVILGGSKAVPN
jgi:hypothetical protein